MSDPPAPPRFTIPSPRPRQDTRAVAILVIAVLATALSIAAAGENVLPGDHAVARYVQKAPQPPAGWLADFGNWVGSGPVATLLAALAVVVFLFARRPWDAGILLLATLARALNVLLKNLIDSPRPTPDFIRVAEIRSTLGFPSGHAMGAMLVFGALAIVAGRVRRGKGVRRGAGIACTGLILLVGFGRVYTGAHWPTDVLGGYLWGAVLLGTIVLVLDQARSKRRRISETG